MSNENSSTTLGLADYLQGVQHFGITVHDMAKSMEFYLEVLGGKLVVSGDGFRGDVLHNTVFEKEELDWIQWTGDLKGVKIPDVRDGTQEVLDIRFISFGNVAVELIHFRDAKLTPNAPNWNGSPSPYNSIEKTCIGYPNVMHLSFHVKDDVDLNQLAKQLEEECRRREIDFIANRIIRVNSEEERRKVALKYMANKFWNDPDYFVEGYSDSDFGDFYGWSLFYAKGPNGEQLEFNQVTRKIKESFMKGQEEYNGAFGTNFIWPSASKTKTDYSALVQRLFVAAESNNFDEYLGFFTEDAEYKIGNAEALIGVKGIQKGIQEIYASVSHTLRSMNHDIKNIWEVRGNIVLCQADVIYTRKDGKSLKLPYITMIQFRGGKIEKYQAFIDVSPVASFAIYP